MPDNDQEYARSKPGSRKTGRLEEEEEEEEEEEQSLLLTQLTPLIFCKNNKQNLDWELPSFSRNEYGLTKTVATPNMSLITYATKNDEKLSEIATEQKVDFEELLLPL